MTSLSRLSNFYPAMSYRRVREKGRVIVYGFGRSLRSADQLPAQLLQRRGVRTPQCSSTKVQVSFRRYFEKQREESVHDPRTVVSQ